MIYVCADTFLFGYYYILIRFILDDLLTILFLINMILILKVNLSLRQFLTSAVSYRKYVYLGEIEVCHK